MRHLAAEIVALAVLFGAGDASAEIIDTRINPANARTYHLLSESTWTDAEAEAIALGGHLVTINDVAEEDWLEAFLPLVRDSIWLGFSDAATEGIFSWSSREVVTYTNWAPGEPNNAGDGEDYVQKVRSGGWNDISNDRGWDVFPNGVVEVAVPEPATGLLLAMGTVMLLAHRRRFTHTLKEATC